MMRPLNWTLQTICLYANKEILFLLGFQNLARHPQQVHEILVFFFLHKINLIVLLHLWYHMGISDTANPVGIHLNNW